MRITIRVNDKGWQGVPIGFAGRVDDMIKYLQDNSGVMRVDRGEKKYYYAMTEESVELLKQQDKVPAYLFKEEGFRVALEKFLDEEERVALKVVENVFPDAEIEAIGSAPQS